MNDMEWQPIETAPEKEPVLAIWCDGYSCQYMIAERRSIDEYNDGFELGWVCAYDGNEPFKIPPSYWMPLPKPPKTASEIAHKL